MPNSVSKGFGPAMRPDSSKRFQRCPATCVRFLSQAPITTDYDIPGLAISAVKQRQLKNRDKGYGVS